MHFEFFDPFGTLSIRSGSLPHWFQPGVTYFVTFRTHDSVPAELSKLWYRRRNDWLRRRGVDPCDGDWKAQLRALPMATQCAFGNLFTADFMSYLDRGHGACVLREPTMAKVVANSLHHFDGVRYRLGDYVVMPNHVHLLCCLLRDTEINSQCSSWKRFSALEINRALEHRSRFWQAESFDHLVRRPQQCDYFRSYIEENPKRAKLKKGEYLH